jgi:RND family efflux transporter MFP subunit
LVIVIGVAVFFFLNRYLASIEVNGFYVKRQDLEVTITATSTGTIKSETEVNITSQRSGRISRLYVEQGDRVKAGDMIAELDTSEVIANLNKAKADLKKAEIDFENAKVEYKRKEALFKESLLTQQQFDEAKRLLSITNAELERARAVLEVSRLQYEYSFIRTPVEGVIAERLVEVGDTTIKGTLIASVVDPDNLYIKAPIDEADIDSVALGQMVKITMDAYPDRIFYGKVLKISPIVIGARHEARTFEVRASISDGDIVLKPGMSADIEIVTKKIEDTLVVPSQAVIEEGDKKIVYVFDDGRAKRREVLIGIYNWNFTEIKNGLTEGEMVIIPPDKPGFREGVRVKVVNLS